jgi:asparagine synthase (glutamine-hydrolysing)
MIFGAGTTPSLASILPGVAPFFESSDGTDLADAFRRSVELHLRSDVTTSLLLSSGVDSSAVALAAHQLGVELQCLTIASAGANDESPDAAVTASRYGHRHAVVEAELDDATIRSFFAAMQRPSIDGLNTYLVCRAVKDRGVKVALSGLGGDEALGGYAHFQLLPLLRVLRSRGGRAGSTRESQKMARLLAADGPRDPWSVDLLQREVLEPSIVEKLSGIDPLNVAGVEPRPSDLDDFDSLVRAETDLYLKTTLLPDADAFSMCSSVELRVPFVDVEVFAAAASARARNPECRGKRALVDGLRDPHLDAIAARKKRGFSLPMPELMRTGALRQTVAALEDPGAALWRQVDRGAALDVIAAAPASRWPEVWVFAALNAWIESVGLDA